MQARILLTTAIVALALAGCGDEPSPAADGRAPARPPSVEGEPAAGLEFAVTTFEGETFRLSDHRGKPVVLNFWESW